MSRILHWCILLLAVLCPLAAHAQQLTDANKKKALELVREAEVFFDQKEFQKAQQKFEEAYRAYPSAKLKYSLGLVFEAEQAWLSAMLAFEEFLTLVPEADRPPGRTQEVNAAVARLAPHLGKLIVTAPASVRFQIDGGTSLMAAGGAVWLSPGTHVVRFPHGERGISVKGGETLSLAAPVEEQPKSPLIRSKRADESKTKPSRGAPVQVATTHRRNKLKIAKWMTLGVGLASLIVGITLWSLDGAQDCNKNVGQVQCPQVLDSANAGISLTALGITTMGTSTMLFVVDHRAEREPSPSLVSLGGRF